MGAQLSAVRGRRVAAGAVVALAAVLAALLRRAMAGRRLEHGTSKKKKTHPQAPSAEGDEPEPETEPEPEPQPSALPIGDYATCLDREWVQKEIRWALEYEKKIITIYEAERDKPGYFDMRKAGERYKGTEWETILNIDAIPYRRGRYEAKAMLMTLFDRATGAKPITRTRGPPKNRPGKWEFFLSHHVALGGDQVSTLHVLLEKVNKRAAWYDKDVTDASEDAMEEGVRCSKYFVLFLTSQPSAQSGAAVDNGPVPLSPQQQPVPASEPEPPAPADDLSALCKTQSASQRAKDRLRVYTERPELRRSIVKWAHQDTGHDPHRCLVLGDPGSGKTTLLSQLTHADEQFQSAVLAYHFCEAALEPTLKPSTFVQKITEQLYLKAPEYKAYVDADPDLRGTVRRILTGSREADQVQDKERQPLRDLTEGVLEPLRAAYPGKTRPQVGHVLVVDSLDEALLPYRSTTHTQGRSIVFLLKHCHATGLFPDWMKVLATSRRDVQEISPAQLSNWHRIDVMDHRAETERTFRDHINRKLRAPQSELLARAGGPDTAQAAANSQFYCSSTASAHFERLVTKADGIFQYLETALKDIEGGSTELEDVGSLPKGLGDLYGHFFERKFGDARSSSYKCIRPVFDAIAASHGGVSETFLQNVLWLADPKAQLHEVQERFKSIGEFLRQIECPQTASTMDRSSSALPLCSRGHEMENIVTDTLRYCDLCGDKSLVPGTVLFRCPCDGCDYDICSACAVGSPLARANSSSGFVADESERWTFYHHSLGEWLNEEQDYRVYAEDGDRALGVVQFASLATKASLATLEKFAAAAVEQLECVNLTGTHLAKLRKKAGKDGARGDVYSFVSHLGKALLDVHTFGKLIMDAEIEVEEPWPWDGEWAHKRGVCHAAGEGNIAALKLFMAAHADLQCGTGLSPLHWAVAKDQRAAISELAAGRGKGCNPVAPGGRRTPLHLAAQGHVESMRKLFACHCAGDINAADSIGMTALHVAAKGAFVNEIVELCDQGIDLEAKEAIGWTALHVAASAGHVEAERVLIEKGADANAPNPVDRTPLHLACCRRSVQASVQTLCEAPNVDLNARDRQAWTPLHWACAKGHVQAVRELLAANADATLLTNSGATALHWACRCSTDTRLDVVNALLDAPGVVVHSQSDESGATPLQWACRHGHIDAIERLRGAADDVDGPEDSLSVGSLRGALSYTDSHGGGVLHWASGAGKHHVVAYLLKAGVDVDARDQDDKTALHEAAKGYLPKELNLKTLKHVAKDTSYLDGAEKTIRCLVKEYHANVSAKTSAGQTALELAKERQEELEKALGSLGAEAGDDIKQALNRHIEACAEVINLLRQLGRA